MNEHPHISIIVPTFNSIKTIKANIASILSQSFGNFEIIVVDGLSKDHTLDTIRAFTDPRIRIVSEKDYGVYDAMNKGIEMARGSWVYFLGSDDILYDKDVLQDIYSIIESTSADVIYGNVLLNLDKKVYDGRFNKYKILKQNISHQALFHKKELFDLFGKYNLRYSILADYAFNLSWFADKRIRVYYIDRTIAIFSQDGMSTHKRDLSFKAERTTIVRKYFSCLYWLFSLFIVPILHFTSRRLKK